MDLSLIRQTGRSQESNSGPLVYKAYANGDVILSFVVVFLGYNQYWPDGFMNVTEKCDFNFPLSLNDYHTKTPETKKATIKKVLRKSVCCLLVPSS